MPFQEVKERQFLLFPTVLVLLSVSEDISGYCFEVTRSCTGFLGSIYNRPLVCIVNTT